MGTRSKEKNGADGSPLQSADRWELTGANTEHKPWKKEAMTLMCVLAEGELLARGEELAKALDKAQELESQGKLIKDQLKEVEGQVTRLRQAVLYKQEMREVTCELVPLFGQGQVTYIRTDTNEPCMSRAMTDEERQGELSL